MSLFHSLNTPLWSEGNCSGSCIWVRLIIAAVSSVVVYQGSKAVGVGVGTVVAVLDCSFGTDDAPTTKITFGGTEVFMV